LSGIWGEEFGKTFLHKSKKRDDLTHNTLKKKKDDDKSTDPGNLCLRLA